MAGTSLLPPESDHNAGSAKHAAKPDLSSAVNETWFREPGSPAQLQRGDKNNLLAEAVTKGESEYINGKGNNVSARDIAALKHEINTQGKDLDQSMLDALQKNRVVAYGDVHLKISPHDEAFTAMLPKLKQAGATHLAIEVPSNNQSMLDTWDDTDKRYFSIMFKGGQGFVDMIDQAKKAGLKVVAADKFYWAEKEQMHPDPDRDYHMASTINGILKDPKAKVIFFVGADHIKSGQREDSHGKSSAQWLRDMGVSVSTFMPLVSAETSDLQPLCQDARRPLGVNVGSVTGLGSFKNETSMPFSRWDNIAVFPAGSGLKHVPADLKAAASDPRTFFKQAFAVNQVVELGEMDRNPLAKGNTAHRTFLEQIMPALKADGLTDLAIDMPASKQSLLDNFVKTGKVDILGMTSDYFKADFLNVMQAARKAGVKLDAVGAESDASMASFADRKIIGANVSRIARLDPHAKVLLWADNYTLYGTQHPVSQTLSVDHIRNISVASLMVGQMANESSMITDLVRRPTVMHTVGNDHLEDFLTPDDVPLKKVDDVIIYPSHTVQDDAVVYNPFQTKGH